MSDIQTIVTDWLKSEQFTQTSVLLDDDQEINVLNPDLQDEVEITGTLEITSTFGFVPTFDHKGNVSIYARFGGPERILYNPNQFGNAKVDRFTNRFGKKANPFVNKVSSKGMLLYFEAEATERYDLQDAIFENQEHRGRTLNSLNQAYPFRIVFEPKADTSPNAFVDLQFMDRQRNEPYGSLFETSNVTARLQFIIYLLQNCVGYLHRSENVNGLQTLRDSVSDRSKLQELVDSFQRYLVSEFIETLKLRGARLYADSFFSGVGFDLQFKQFIDQMKEDNPGKSTNQTLQIIKGFLEEQIEVSDAVFNAVQEVFKGISLLEAANEATKVELERSNTEIERLKTASAKANLEYQASVETLEQKIKAQAKDFEQQNSFKFSMIGAAAGVGAAYYTLYKDKPDLEDWERGAILAIGGLLGSIPYLNVVSIAATPILIEKGIEFKKNRS